MAASKPAMTMRMLPNSRSFFLHSRYLSSHAISASRVYTPEDARTSPDEPSQSISQPADTTAMPPPLSLIATPSLVRAIVINSISCNKTLLSPSLWMMDKLAHATSPLLNPDRNPLLKYFLKKTFYAQFCAGENQTEVAHTVKSLKEMGFKGVMLAYAKEVVLPEGAVKALTACQKEGGEEARKLAEQCIEMEILPWKEGTMRTIEMCLPDEFTSIKFTGAGTQALFDLSQNNMPSPAMDAAITQICDLAVRRNVHLQFDAEQQSLQKGIDNWAVHYMRKYNGITPGKATIHNTYQCYLKALPGILASHLALARIEGWTLGAKLVRGAYLGSDPRHLINDTKSATDTQYDGVAEALMRRTYNHVLQPAIGEESQPFPAINMVLAGHNHDSVHKALAIRTEQVRRGEQRTKMAYAQLQGMADEISCELIMKARGGRGKEETEDVPSAYKYLVWGSTGECMKYLLRRARENRDAMGRTREGRDAMAGELWRRLRGAVGLRA